MFMEADAILMAIGQENSYPWIERDIGLEFGKWDMPMKYNQTPAGGTCAPGCHTKQTYTRGD